MKIYDFEECEAIAFDFRLETEMFLINEPWSIPQVGRDTTVTNLAIAIGTACQWQLIYLNISGLIRAVLPIWQICWKLSDLWMRSHRGCRAIERHPRRLQYSKSRGDRRFIAE
jgi:hypothetical protein